MKRALSIVAVALVVAAMMVVMAAPAFAAKTSSFQQSGGCVTKAGQGGGSGEIKDQHHGACNSNGASF